MARNPLAKNFRVLGKTQAQWDAIKTVVTAFLVARENLEEIPDAQIRGAHPDLADDRVWNEIKRDLGIT